MESHEAYVTLVTSDSYVAGALVLGQSIRSHCPSVGPPIAPCDLTRAASASLDVNAPDRIAPRHGSRRLVCLVPHGWLAEDSLAALATVWDEVRPVTPLDSGDASRLALLRRPELGQSLTKIRVWQQTDLRRVLFMDADMLVLQSLDALFATVHGCSSPVFGNDSALCICSQACCCPCPGQGNCASADKSGCWPLFAAAPDAGWPDCFNSGLFVTQPSLHVHDELETRLFTTGMGSFDGGDQGLLNSYFDEWRLSPAVDISAEGRVNSEAFASNRLSRTVRLPFTVNMTLNGEYGYLPALHAHRNAVRAVHFIGARKPWMRERTASNGGQQDDVLNTLYSEWWRVHDSLVLPLITGLGSIGSKLPGVRAYFQSLYRAHASSGMATCCSGSPRRQPYEHAASGGDTSVPQDVGADYFATYRIKWADDVESFFQNTRIGSTSRAAGMAAEYSDAPSDCEDTLPAAYLRANAQPVRSKSTAVAAPNGASSLR